MNIGGFLKQSFVDFPANISAVIFTNGCSFDCWYCHNKGLLSLNNKPKYNFDEIYQFLESRKNFLDGVVISGGEPTLQKDLEEVIDKIKELGLKVKLDTNGTNPSVLQKLLPKLDYVAMDIKNSLEGLSFGMSVVGWNWTISMFDKVAPALAAAAIPSPTAPMGLVVYLYNCPIPPVAITRFRVFNTLLGTLSVYGGEAIREELRRHRRCVKKDSVATI
ncbi:MAG: anaerobic ribonucleoside-triphosphate reductase activating protein [Clostridia bacterium]|nr:anaerobic ribonucleoside-triphosphate reductase activating protein [Clostridia bacterium]